LENSVPIQPVAVALVLCEFVVVDEKSRNITAVSCFSRRVFDGGLEFLPPFYVVATFVNGHGNVSAKLVIERLDTLEITWERAITLRFPDSLREQSAIFRVRSVAIPVHGFYDALLIVENEVIAQKRFSIFPKEI
jgi:hypothetical protein